MRIVTPESEMFSGEAEYLSLNTPDGRAGFLRGALPRLAVISEGEISVKAPWAEEKFIGGDGVMEITDGEILILVSQCRKVGDSENKNFGDSGSEFKYAKARVVSSIRKMNEKTGADL